MIQFDEFTFSLPRLWIAASLLALLDLLLVSSMLIRAPRLDALFAPMPRGIAAAIFLLGPLVCAALWVIAAALAIWFHRLRGLWLLVTALFILPATYLHAVLVWSCAVGRQCL